MKLNLHLRFPDPAHAIVRLDNDETKLLPFHSPLQVEDQQDLKWYLEIYAAYYTTDVDDKRAERIAEKLPDWGAALFEAVFKDRHAFRLFERFLSAKKPGRLLTINSDHPTILAQPWELLRDPSSPSGIHLFHENPRISIRRWLTGAGQGRDPFPVKPKDRLHLLFVVSRPEGMAFLDPRSDPQAVLDALDAQAPGRVDVEFLRPATLDNLTKRLNDRDRVDILHFDGHGFFDPDGRLEKQAGKATVPAGMESLLRETSVRGNQGYLCFEEKDGSMAPISAALLGAVLHQQRVGLVVLSACQSAAVGGEDPMGSVAARLTHAGIPTVLAMTHSVLVATTRALFNAFYEQLAQSRPVGESLDNARRQLYSQRKRGERQRGRERVTLTLQDWFLPALYQVGKDTPLLKRAKAVTAPPSVRCGNPPKAKESGFVGRSRELWEIEQAFVDGTRRLTITGFGGQGKTHLAEEAGRWLHRTDMFKQVCSVRYAGFQGVDAVEMAVSTLARVLGRTLLDATAVTATLQKQPVLVILDNLESLAEQPLRELLDAAKDWSEAGNSRLLLTTRQDDLKHSSYPLTDSNKHRHIELKGLDAEDALAWFQKLVKLSSKPRLSSPQLPLPGRDDLLKLFRLVDFHPLSISVLAWQLTKTGRITELGERLKKLLQDMPDTEDNPEKSLLASLNLSLERLTPATQRWLPRLGVFHGGAMEDVLLAITELKETEWSGLREELATTGLLQVEHMPSFNQPYLKFHPTLAPVLWLRLTEEEQADLSACHRQRYYELSAFLYREWKTRPHEAGVIAQRELPNLLHAVRRALQAGNETAVEFVNNICQFLDNFGLQREWGALALEAEQAAGAVGSHSWYLVRAIRGEQLITTSRYKEAKQVFEDTLLGLGTEPSLDRCGALNLLGRCLYFQGLLEPAGEWCRQGLAEARRLESSDKVRLLMAGLQMGLADVLKDKRDFPGSAAASEAALAIYEELAIQKGIVDANTQLGHLALLRNNLPEAERRYRDALSTFQQLRQPASEARCWSGLGNVYRRRGWLEDAERSYRISAHIWESLGRPADAAAIWYGLARVIAISSRLAEAEDWYRKALKGYKEAGDHALASKVLNNFADFLKDQPGRLAEARQRAEEALEICGKAMDSAGMIARTYGLLAEIADREGHAEQAHTYRRLEQEKHPLRFS